ncbi:hypothetical protein B0H11DRAFT_1912191 [Mycena galericulata]|nr:hypothetical protein B0H11DRAFT_1912191 [Mycena galericulata]
MSMAAMNRTAVFSFMMEECRMDPEDWVIGRTYEMVYPLIRMWPVDLLSTGGVVFLFEFEEPLDLLDLTERVGRALMNTTLPPKFPPELERPILELCALLWPSSILKLMLVAKRFKEWIQPLLYRTLVLTSQPGLRLIHGYAHLDAATLLRIFETKPYPSLQSSIRHLHLDHPTREILGAIAPLFNFAENIRIHGTPAFWVLAEEEISFLMAGASPRRVYTASMTLFDNLPPSHRFFSQLTHLEITGESFARIDSDGYPVCAMPCLTHLSFTWIGLIPACNELLKKCPALSVLVFLNPPLVLPDLAVNLLLNDLRFVTIPLENLFHDWLAGIHDDSDYWSRADDIVARRRVEGTIVREYSEHPLKYAIRHLVSRSTYTI